MGRRAVLCSRAASAIRPTAADVGADAPIGDESVAAIAAKNAAVKTSSS